MVSMSGEESVIVEAEGKIEELIAKMRDALSQEGVPQFRVFWDARKEFHEVFKECKNPLFKSKMWKELTELTTEARRIKEILDEQAKFAVEQIELVLKGLADDVEKGVITGGVVELPEGCRELKKNEKSYERLQGRINHFTKLMSRLKEIRGEIIKTEMRIRHKNRLLKEISSLGDRFIPERKELVEQISDAFLSDVQKFYAHNFGEDTRAKTPLRLLREEIKGYQTAAKTLSVNSRVFKESRGILAKAWDTISQKADENRQVYEQKKEIFAKNFAELEPKVAVFVEKAQTWKLASLFQEYKALTEEIEKIELDRKEKQTLLAKVEGVFHEQRDILQKEEAEARVKAAEERQKKMADYEKQLATASRKSLETLKTLRRKLIDEGDAFSHFVATVELAILKKEGDGDGTLAKWESLAKECREKLDDLRKQLGQSGFDFERAMEMRAEFDQTKARLAEIEEAMGKL